MKTKIEKDLGMCDQKEREFMEELYRKYERLMYATVRRYISDSMEQEEIVQESLKKLIEKRRVLCNLSLPFMRRNWSGLSRLLSSTTML